VSSLNTSINLGSVCIICIIIYGFYWHIYHIILNCGSSKYFAIFGFFFNLFIASGPPNKPPNPPAPPYEA